MILNVFFHFGINFFSVESSDTGLVYECGQVKKGGLLLLQHKVLRIIFYNVGDQTSAASSVVTVVGLSCGTLTLRT